MKNSSRVRLAKEVQEFGASLPPGSLVLDAGSGDAPYRLFFQHTRFLTTDLMRTDKAYAKPSFIADLSHIPLKAESLDGLLFNQVIEHVEEPTKVLGELNRVLVLDGKLFFSGPLFYEEHETPYDYQRFTQYGLRRLFEQNGFVIEKLDWLEGYFGTVAYQLANMSKYLPLKGLPKCKPLFKVFLLPFLLLFKVAAAALAIVFHELELIYKYTGAGHPKNYFAILSKRGRN
mgnify:FL=1